MVLRRRKKKRYTRKNRLQAGRPGVWRDVGRFAGERRGHIDHGLGDIGSLPLSPQTLGMTKVLAERHVRYPVGKLVEAQVGRKWYPARVTKISGGKYTVQYEDEKSFPGNQNLYNERMENQLRGTRRKKSRRKKRGGEIYYNPLFEKRQKKKKKKKKKKVYFANADGKPLTEEYVISSGRGHYPPGEQQWGERGKKWVEGKKDVIRAPITGLRPVASRVPSSRAPPPTQKSDLKLTSIIDRKEDEPDVAEDEWEGGGRRRNGGRKRTRRKRR